jgi:hypothetical protein
MGNLPAPKVICSFPSKAMGLEMLHSVMSVGGGYTSRYPYCWGSFAYGCIIYNIKIYCASNKYKSSNYLPPKAMA